MSLGTRKTDTGTLGADTLSRIHPGIYFLLAGVKRANGECVISRRVRIVERGIQVMYMNYYYY